MAGGCEQVGGIWQGAIRMERRGAGSKLAIRSGAGQGFSRFMSQDGMKDGKA